MGRGTRQESGGGGLSGGDRDIATREIVSSVNIPSRLLPYQESGPDPSLLLEARGLTPSQAYCVESALFSTKVKHYPLGESPNDQQLTREQAEDLAQRIRVGVAGQLHSVIMGAAKNAAENNTTLSGSQLAADNPDVVEIAQLVYPNFTDRSLAGIANDPELSPSGYFRALAEDLQDEYGIDLLTHAGMDENDPESFVRELIDNGGRWSVESIASWYSEEQTDLYRGNPLPNHGTFDVYSYEDYLGRKLSETISPSQQSLPQREVLARALGVSPEPEKLSFLGKETEEDPPAFPLGQDPGYVLEDGRLVSTAAVFTWEQEDGPPVAVALREERNADGRVLRAIAVVPGDEEHEVSEWYFEVSLAEAYGDRSEDTPEARVLEAGGDQGIRQNVSDTDIILSGGSRQYLINHIEIGAEIALRKRQAKLEEVRKQQQEEAVNPEKQIERLLS